MAKKPAILRSRGRPLPPPNFGPTTHPGAPDSPCKLQIISSAVLWCLSQQGFYTKKSKTTAPSFQFSRKRDGKWEALGRSCVVLVQRRTVENGGTFQTFREEKIAKLLPKNIARTARIQFEKWHLLFKEYLLDWTSPHVHIYLYFDLRKLS